ncbi:hypothetical protein AVEN_105591-1, partial [Araneus ventricosus]
MKERKEKKMKLGKKKLLNEDAKTKSKLLNRKGKKK